MPRFDAMTGPYNSTFSLNVAAEQTINWIPERNGVSVNEMGTDVSDKNVRCALIRTPGLQTFVTLPKSPVRGVFPGEFRLFAAAGDSYYEIFSNGTYVDRCVPGFSGSSGGPGPAGTNIGNDGLPVQWFANGGQALIISAGQAYCDSGNGPVPAQFSDPLMDLLIDPTDTSGKTLTTPTGNFFDQSDVGRTVTITGGVGFYLQSQVIQSVDTNGGAVALNSWGVPGSSLGIGYEKAGGLSFSDLMLVNSAIEVHSPTKVFGPSDIGTQLTITSGTGWTLGTYTIIGLPDGADGTPSGNAILDRPAGSVGASAGVGTTAPMLVTASQGAFLDGYYFVVPFPRNKTVYFSAINDGNTWNPLDFFKKENYPDNIAALFSDHQELYTFGDLESTQVWRDTGAADNPFSPDPGAAMHIGIQATYSVVRLANGVAWLGQDTRRGTRRAYHATGYNPVAVSTPAIEAEWATYSTITDAVAFTIADQGHECWVINFPTANRTWVYDALTGWWHQWAWWNGLGWDRARTWVHTVVALNGLSETHYGGDWSTGQIYAISRQYKTDDGHPIVRRRRAPHLTKENMRRFYARFEIDCDRLGTQRIFWNRLGNGRDRLWQMDASQTSETAGVLLTLGYSDDNAQSVQTFFSQTLPAGVDVTLCNAYLNWVDATWH